MASLDTLYADEGLPPLQPLKPGENAMLDQQQVADFARRVRQPQRTPRASQKKTSD